MNSDMLTCAVAGFSEKIADIQTGKASVTVRLRATVDEERDLLGAEEVVNFLD